MAKLYDIVHSEDACTMIFKGDKHFPEPHHGIIKFRGGSVEVARCSDGSYWAHISINDGTDLEPDGYSISSRIDYDHDGHVKHGIIDVPDADKVKHIAINIGVK